MCVSPTVGLVGSPGGELIEVYPGGASPIDFGRTRCAFGNGHQTGTKAGSKVSPPLPSISLCSDSAWGTWIIQIDTPNFQCAMTRSEMGDEMAARLEGFTPHNLSCIEL